MWGWSHPGEVTGAAKSNIYKQRQACTLDRHFPGSFRQQLGAISNLSKNEVSTSHFPMTNIHPPIGMFLPPLPKMSWKPVGQAGRAPNRQLSPSSWFEALFMYHVPL
jgi:hypothetical protein